MTLFLDWLKIFLFLAIFSILYEVWQAASAIAKDRTKSLDRYF